MQRNNIYVSVVAFSLGALVLPGMAILGFNGLNLGLMGGLFVAEGQAVEGMESLAPALVDDMEMLVDLMPDDTHVLVLDPERARSRAHDLVATSEEFLEASWAVAAGGGQAPIDLQAASYRSLADVRALSLAQRKPWWSVSPFGLLDVDELNAVQGKRADIGGYYAASPTKAGAVMRPSPTFNVAIDRLS